MNDTTIIGIDIAKNVFQLYGTNSYGKKTMIKRVSRSKLPATIALLPSCLIGW